MVRILLVTDDSSNHRVVFAFLPWQYTSMRNHRIGICNNHMGIRNHYVGVDRKFGLKEGF